MRDRGAVERFHLLFLAELGRQLDKQLYAVKGGCNLRFFFHSPRYSEDLDIDVRTINPRTLANKVSRVLGSRSFRLALETQGLALGRVTTPKQTDTTQRWKAALDVAAPEASLRTKIEFSRRGIDEGTAFDPVDPTLIGRYNLAPVFLTHYTSTTAFMQKTRALAGRAETQARDVFDLDLLLRAGGRPQQITGLDRSDIDCGVANAMTVTFDDYVAQVQAYLPDGEPGVPSSPADWDQLVLRVVTALEGLPK